MKYFVVYTKSTGEIIRSGICQEADLYLQNQLNEEVLEGQGNSDTAYVANETLILYTQDQIAKKQNKPFYLCQWSNETFEWIDLRTDEQKYIQYDNTAKLTRNELLVQSDWTQLPDVTLANKQDWAVYRQALRDIPQQSGYPFNIIWPVKPE
jgi:hypothetical protein